jgi:hypothetical protein
MGDEGISAKRSLRGEYKKREEEKRENVKGKERKREFKRES